MPQVSLSPNADGSALRLVLSGNQIVVPDKLIAQACPFVRDEFFHCVVLLELYCFSGFLPGLLTVIIGKLIQSAVDCLKFFLLLLRFTVRLCFPFAFQFFGKSTLICDNVA